MPIVDQAQSPAAQRWRVPLAGALLVLVALAAYHNSFGGPFIYDDISAIPENPTIKHLWPIGDVLAPPRDSGVTVNGRPILNLSLAINYAIGGTSVWGYHATNLAIHTLAGLMLFGLVRHTLLRPGLREQFGHAALSLSWIVAALWLAHPLQTESVTYMVQRAESLVGMFYLLTLYCLVRSIDAPSSKIWPALTIVACLLGMGSKEVMVSAPIIALLYDRTFGAGTFKAAWEARRRLYVGLAATWGLLAMLVVSTGGRGGTAGFGAGGMTWWSYAFTQCRAIVRYGWLSLWPGALVFDYGDAVEKHFLAIAPQALVIVAVVTATFIALWRRPTWGFLGICFLAVLAPSSSILPIATETMAEHRMYLPLAAVIVGVVLGCATLSGRSFRPIFFVVLCSAITLTVRRNEDYGNELVLWTDVLQKWPSNSRAHNNVGEIFFRRHQPELAIAQFREAVRLLPGYIDALDNMGNVYAQTGRPAEALPSLELALKLRPDYAPTHTNLGNALYALGREDEAIAHFEAAIRLKANYADPHNNLGVILGKRGRVQEAIAHYKRALEIKPEYADAHYNYGNALAEINQLDEATAHYRAALRIQPNYPEVLNNFGRVAFLQGRAREAMAHYERALFLRPNYADAHSNYAVALYGAGRLDEAIAHLRRALEINPNFQDAKNNLAQILSRIQVNDPKQ